MLSKNAIVIMFHLSCMLRYEYVLKLLPCKIPRSTTIAKNITKYIYHTKLVFVFANISMIKVEINANMCYVHLNNIFPIINK